MKNKIQKSKLTTLIKLTFIFLVIAYVLVGIVFLDSDEDFFLLFIGLLMQLLFTTAIVFRKNIYVFEPITLMYFAITMGVTIKIPYLIVNHDIMSKLLLGKDQSIFIYGSLFILLGFISFIFGQIMAYKTVKILTFEKNQFWLENRLNLTLVLFLVVTATATLLLINQIGISNLLESFSAKRFQDLDDRSGRLSSNLYFYYKLSLLARVPLYISLIYILKSNRKTGFTRLFCKFVFCISLIITLTTPTILNNRAAVALSIIDLVFIASFLKVKIKTSYLITAALLIIIPFVYSTAQRTFSELNYNVFSSILDNRYFLDLTKTSQIINYFSDNGERLYGETLIGWFFLLIPSSFMENQPRFMEIGLYLGNVVFNFSSSSLTGVPPGYIAELYMNFGTMGIVIGMFIFGFSMQKMYNNYLKKSSNILITVTTAMISVRFLIFLFNNDLGTFIIKNLLETLPTIIMLAYLLKTPKNIRHSSQ